MKAEIRVDTVIVEGDLIPINMKDKAKRSELISAMQGLQKSDAWKIMRGYFVTLLVNADSALDTVGNPNEALLIAAKRSLLRRVVAFPESMLTLAEAHIKQELIDEKKKEEQPIHPQAPRFGGKKKE